LAWGKDPDSDFAENADGAGAGADTYEEYLADTDPAASSRVLELSGLDADLARFSLPESPSRYCQLEYGPDITNPSSVGVSNPPPEQRDGPPDGGPSFHLPEREGKQGLRSRAFHLERRFHVVSKGCQGVFLRNWRLIRICGWSGT